MTRGIQKAKSFLAAVLLLLYIAGNIQPELLHGLSHVHEEEELHTAQAELDPCHRTLYHATANDGCDHAAHISAPKKCAACHLVFHAAHVATPTEAAITITRVEQPASSGIYTPVIAAFTLLSSRAPPTI